MTQYASSRPARTSRNRTARPQSDRFQPGRGRFDRAQTGRSDASGVPAPRLTSNASLDAALEAALDEAAARPQPETSSFAGLGLPQLLVEALAKRGVHTPFAIQTRALPDALAGRDVLGRAQTGSGKTLAFGLPMLARLAPEAADLDGRRGVDSASTRPRRTPGAPRGLVLVPTRELAQQVTRALTPLADPLALRIATVVGGVPYGKQLDALARGVDVLVATPGRLVDLIERGACRLDAVEISVLDEADYMGDLGFLPVVARLLDLTPVGQRMLFSATLDRGVGTLVRRYLSDPAVHAVAPAASQVTTMTHRVFTIRRDHKPAVAAEVAARPARTLFFVRTKFGADRLARQLGESGVDAVAIHGNLGQGARQRALASFAEGSTRVLVATDVAARGIHVDDVDLVVHYDPPNDHKDYLHRSGRTARAGADGTVLAFVEPAQVREVRRLHAAANVEPTVDDVHPGHPAVREVATSGEPVVVRPRERTEGHSGQRSARRGGRRSEYRGEPRSDRRPEQRPGQQRPERRRTA